MYRKDVNDLSPMRVFEKSMHGGLGRGNIGVVVARPGIGKTAILVQIALDDLMRDRKVLHLSHEHAVDHVRAYYDEIFHDLAGLMKLDAPEAVRLDIEKNRMIYSHLGNTKADPPSKRGGTSSVKKILDTVAFARDIAHFEPDVIILDAFDFTHASGEAMQSLRDMARDLSVELWISAQVDVRSAPSAGIPEPLRAVQEHLSVVVLLDAEKDNVRLRLLKDHDNAELADLHLVVLCIEDLSLEVFDLDPVAFNLVG